MLRLALTLALALILALPLTAAATVGGPAEVEMLGYDPVTASVLFTRTDGFEDDSPPQLYRLALDGPRPRRAVHLPRPDADESAPDPHAELLARLQPLVQLPDTAVDLRTERPCGGCRLRAHLSGDRVSSRSVTVVGPREQVRVLSVWRVPERRQAIAVLSYVGVLMEGGYDKHEPVLLGYHPPRRH